MSFLLWTEPTDHSHRVLSGLEDSIFHNSVETQRCNRFCPMDYATSRGQHLFGLYFRFPSPCWHPEHTANEGSNCVALRSSKISGKHSCSAKAELLPLRSHTSFSFIIHSSQTQTDCPPPLSTFPVPFPPPTPAPLPPPPPTQGHSKSYNNAHGEKNDLKITVWPYFELTRRCSWISSPHHAQGCKNKEYSL